MSGSMLDVGVVDDQKYVGLEERAVTLDTVQCPDSKYVVDIFKVQILRKFGLQRLEGGNVWAKCEVIVASPAQTGKRAVFWFMNERAKEVSKLIEEGGTYYITEVMVSRPNELVTNRKFDLTQWHGFCYRAPERFSFSQFLILKCSFSPVSELEDTDAKSVVNVEAVFLDDGGVMRFESGKNLKKLVLADIVNWVGSDPISIVGYKLVGEDIDAFKYGTGVNLQITDVTVKSFRGIVELIPTRLTQYMVVGENMDIMSIRGAEHVPVVREDTEEVVRATVWKEVLCGSGELLESGWYKVAVRVDRCVEYNGCMNCGSKTMEDPLSGKRHCGKCKSALWSSVKKYKVDYTLLDGTEAGKGVHAIGFSNLKFIGDAGHDKVFLDLKVEGGKDVVIVKVVC